MKIYKVKVNGKVYEVEIESVTEQQGSIDTPKAESSSVSASGEKVTVAAPMAGTILELKVKAGDQVKKGQVIAILEAMKLENEVVSTADGKVVEVLVSKGQAVSNQQGLIVLG